jgi:hypothetical protein
MNIAKKEYHPMKAILAHLPGEHFTMDLAGPFPRSSNKNVYLLVLVDVCTRFVLLDALENKTLQRSQRRSFTVFPTLVFPKFFSLTMAKNIITDF